MRAMEHVLKPRMSEIMETWANEAETTAAARGMTRPELVNVLPLYLESLLEVPMRPANEQAELIESHLSSRLRAGFNLAEVIEEFAILGRAIVRAWSAVAAEGHPAAFELDPLLLALQRAMGVVTQAFQQYLHEDLQLEKRYFRLLQLPFTDPVDGESPLSTGRLQKVLNVLMEVTTAATAALFLYDPRTQKLIMAASVGRAAEPLEGYARTLSPSSFVGAVANSERATSIYDVETTTLDVPDELRHSGIHALLGVRLPLARTLLGVVYIGLREQRGFSPSEVRRLEALGDRLALHLDNARLYSEVLSQVDALEVQRGLRTQFVSILAHDLRGPLTSAKMAASLLVAKIPADCAAHCKWVKAILRNLDLVDAMVTDMLDVERIQAGKQLALRLAACDLGAIAREVVEDLDAEHPDRFRLHAEEGVCGLWSAGELRRAIWNLATNAIKYGAKDAPITLKVRKRAGGAELSVHNEGPAIPAEEQATLFEPFARAANVEEAKGWGLGLTLVRACADAHGGSIDVHSAPGQGTTFTLHLPEKAQPPGQAT